uniref:Reverse transcriptase Ty1/copia-type domain-containing protein n=1 Tax=Fagus sylvatica TaxID=28930 RepID=A0A2N9IDW1_FAGSY
MTPIFTDPSIDLYPDPVRDSAPPSSSSDVPSLVLSPAADSPNSDPAPSAPSDTNPLWQQAMADELDALHKTHTWDMTTLPPGKSAVGCKWVYKIKTRADGSVERYKAHLVAKGFTQEYGIDYEETFAPVARLTSVRSLLAVAAEVYMQPPPGYPDSQNQVCRLRRAFYGLKQALRAWFAKFSSVVVQQGFTPSSYDSTLFIRHTFTGITLILLYVDDMIITGDDTTSIRDLQKFLSQHFEMKDLGTLSYFLGLEVTSSSDGYYLSQAKYAFDLLSKADLTDSKTVSTPLELNVKLNTIDGEPLSDATTLNSIPTVSSILLAPVYIAICLLSPVQTLLMLFIWEHSFMVFTSRHSLPLSCAPMLMQTGLEIPLIVALLPQLSTVLSPMPPRNSFWLHWLLADMGASQTTSTPIHCDNRSAIHTLPIMMFFHERTKHIEIDCHFIRHHLQQSALHLLSVSSEDQLADVFTKSHPPGRLRDLVSKLKMASSSPPCV